MTEHGEHHHCSDQSLFTMQMVQPGPPICIRYADETEVQQQGHTLPSEVILAPAQGVADPYSITAGEISPSALAGAAEACQEHSNPQAVHYAAAAQPLAQSPATLTGSMPAAPAVPEADVPQHGSESGTRVALIPAEAADVAEASAGSSGPQAAPATGEVAVLAPTNKAARASSRKPARRRKSRNPAARALAVAPLPDQGQSRNTDGDITQRQLAKPGRSLRSGRTQEIAVLACTGSQAPMADCVGDGQPPHLHRSSNDGHFEEAEGAPAEAQPRESHTSPATLDAAPVDAATAVTLTTLGCSKCRFAPLGCSSCRPRPAAAKPKASSSGRRGRKRAAPAPALADVLPTSIQAPRKGKKARLHTKFPPAEAPEPSSRATRASQRALSKAATSKNEESDDEQLAVRPMPASLRHRQQRKSSQAKAGACNPPVVRATSQSTVTVSEQPSSSGLAQTATLDSGTQPKATRMVPEPIGKAPCNLRRSARRQHSAQPAQQGTVPPQGVSKAAAQADAPAAPAGIPAAAAAAAAVAVAAASAAPVAPDALRRSSRVRRPARLQYDSVTEAQGSKSPPEQVIKARPARRQAGAKSASSKGTKRGAAERSVISDSENDNTSASTAAAGADAGKSTARRKKLRRQQFELSPIMEDDEEQQQQPGPAAASEFVSHRVHTQPETALHLAGLSPAEKRKRRRKVPGAARASAKTRLAASAETSQLQPEYSSGLDALLFAVDRAQAEAEQESLL